MITMICETCGKEFEIDFYTIGDYIYKRRKGNKTYFFCGFNCRKKWDDKKRRLK